MIARSQTTTSRARSYAQRSLGAAGGGAQKGNAAILPGMQFGTLDEDLSRSGAERTLEHLKRQSLALAKIWLLSAASFRRAGQLKESRSAIQEAERLQPGLADVWVQLSLYFASNGSTRLAVDSLYKALACSGADVAASVHLARLFLADPELKPKSGSAKSGEVELHTAPATGPHKYESSAEASTSAKAKDLSSVSLAEGLLTTTTKGAGWDSSEAWLFLGRRCRGASVRSERESVWSMRCSWRTPSRFVRFRALCCDDRLSPLPLLVHSFLE